MVPKGLLWTWDRKILFGVLLQGKKVLGSLPASRYPTWMPNILLEGQRTIWEGIANEVVNELDTFKGGRIPNERAWVASKEEQQQQKCRVECTSRNLETKWGQRSWKETLDQLDRPGILADSATYASLVRWCGNAKALSDGKRVHDHIIKSRLERNLFLGSLLVQMYGKCGALEDARRMFDKMKERNVSSWNFMIGAYARHGQGKAALQLFDQMQREGVVPDRITFASILSACASQPGLSEGKRMHARIVGSGHELDFVVGTALVNMYGKCSSLVDARRMFDKIPERDVVSWNAMISSYTQNGQGKDALQLFGQMQHEGVMPDKVTSLSILSACASQAALADGERMHTYIKGSGFEADVAVGNALVNMYGKCGSFEGARRTFDQMPERDVVSWTAIIGVYAQNGQGKEVLQLFDQMQWEGVMPDKVAFVSILSACAIQAALPEGKRMHARIVGCGFESDVVVGNALINMYGKCGSLEDARRMFDKMPERDGVSWNAMIAAYAQHGQGKAALQLFDQMQWEGVRPDKVTFVSVLSACASQSALAEGERMHACIVSSGFELDVDVGNALLNMYGKCGSLTNARRMFDKMPERDRVSWNAMIAAHSQHGQGKEALQLFDQMQLEGVMPNEVTFVSILFACSHAGLVDEGCYYFASMIRDHGITPVVDHYNCMIDLLGRVGRLDEAEDLINNMPLQPTVVSLMALLGACRYKVDVERGERVAKYAFELDPENAAPYVMLSNIYAAAGKGDSAAKVINMMKEKGLKKLQFD